MLLQSWLENWEAMYGGPEVMLYDFGNSTAVMPINEGGNWLTTSICYLCVCGSGKPTADSLNRKGLADVGGGWFFYGVEMPFAMTRDELFTVLDSAKEKLLAGVKQHGKQVDAKS
jgi:hypothetical protein